MIIFKLSKRFEEEGPYTVKVGYFPSLEFAVAVISYQEWEEKHGNPWGYRIVSFDTETQIETELRCDWSIQH